eukprot:10313429-Karenia_brevis.AAC.1
MNSNRPRRHARAGRKTRSTMGVRSMAWHMAGHFFARLRHVLPTTFTVQTLRRYILHFLFDLVWMAEQDVRGASGRGPQDVDPPEHDYGSVQLNALYEHFHPGDDTSTSTRSR